MSFFSGNRDDPTGGEGQRWAEAFVLSLSRQPFCLAFLLVQQDNGVSLFRSNLVLETRGLH